MRLYEKMHFLDVIIFFLSRYTSKSFFCHVNVRKKLKKGVRDRLRKDLYCMKIILMPSRLFETKDERYTARATRREILYRKNRADWRSSDGCENAGCKSDDMKTRC